MSTSRSHATMFTQPVAVTLAAPEVLREVVEITHQLFPGPIAVESSHDPENPHDEFTVLTVEATGGIDEILERECQWIQCVADIVPGLGAFRLAINPK
jgi:hypothetical protein